MTTVSVTIEFLDVVSFYWCYIKKLKYIVKISTRSDLKTETVNAVTEIGSTGNSYLDLSE